MAGSGEAETGRPGGLGVETRVGANLASVRLKFSPSK